MPSDLKAPTKPTVLVVDDEPDIRTLLVDLLRDDGYTVHSAVDGVAALESFVEHRPDLILLDVDMPRLNGIDTLRAIRGQSSEATVIMISGKASDADIERTLALGAADYIAKPFDLSHLLRVVESAA